MPHSPFAMELEVPLRWMLIHESCLSRQQVPSHDKQLSWCPSAPNCAADELQFVGWPLLGDCFNAEARLCSAPDAAGAWLVQFDVAHEIRDVSCPAMRIGRASRRLKLAG